MQIHKLGPSECPITTHRDDFDWCIYWYNYVEDEYYGEGTSITYCSKENQLYVRDLGHCSCFGPMDNDFIEANVGIEFAEKITPEEYLSKPPNQKEVFTESCEILLYNKVKELLESNNAGTKS